MIEEWKKYIWVGVAGFLFAGVVASYVIINYAYPFIPEIVVDLVRKPELVKNAKAKDCADCHEEIFEAWKKSRHFQAWTSSVFIEDSENRSKEKCLSCHAPDTVKPGEKPSLRLEHRDSGVFCISCHVRDGAIEGPFELFSPPHPTRKNQDYRKSKFCSSCHPKTFKEWKAISKDAICQDCHMRRNPGRLTQKFPLSFFHSSKQVANHSFPAGIVEDEDIAVDYEWKGASITVKLTNKFALHNLPTADNGDPRFYLYLTLFDVNNEEIDRAKEILAPQQETALIYGQPTPFLFLAPKGTARAEIEIMRKPAWTKEKQSIKKLEILPSS